MRGQPTLLDCSRRARDRLRMVETTHGLQPVKKGVSDGSKHGLAWLVEYDLPVELEMEEKLQYKNNRLLNQSTLFDWSNTRRQKASGN